MAVTTRVAILGKIEPLVELPARLEGGLDNYLDAAVEKFSRDKPYEFVEDTTVSTAGNLQSVPTNWDEDFSILRKIVWPYEDEDSQELADDSYEIEKIPVGGTPTPKIRFIPYSPEAADVFRAWYSRRQVCTEASCTIQAGDLQAVVYLTAYLIEIAKASHYNALKDQGGIGADLVDYGAKAAEARASAASYKSLYTALIGGGEDGVRAMSVVGDIDTDPQYPYRSAMTHHRPYER